MDQNPSSRSAFMARLRSVVMIWTPFVGLAVAMSVLLELGVAGPGTGVGALGDGHFQALGKEAHLGDEPRCTSCGFGDGAPEDLAVTDQGVDGFAVADLGAHAVLEQALKALHIKLSQQRPEG
jgi:hypothetical protein